MTATISPAPRPLCAAFAPLLPLISSGALEEDEATPAREHVAGCAWCQQELARYVAVDEALRRQFGATSENVLPFPFDLDSDDDVAKDYGFTLEDTLEETMAEGTNQQPSTTARSSRWGERKRGPGPRTTAIAGIAAALILAVIAATIYTLPMRPVILERLLNESTHVYQIALSGPTQKSMTPASLLWEGVGNVVI